MANVKRTSYTTCDTCTDIVVNGYTDSIDCEHTHKARVLNIDGQLPKGHYWSSYTDKDVNQHNHTCDLCGAGEAQHTIQSLVLVT